MRTFIQRQLLETVAAENRLNAAEALLNALAQLSENTMPHQSRDFDDMMAEARRQGWTLTQTNASHWRAKPPDPSKTIVYFAVSVEPRAFKNTIAEMRKRGFVWPAPSRNEQAAGGETGTSEWTDERVKAISDRAETVLAPMRDDNGSITFPSLPPKEPDTHATESSEQRIERLFAELRDAKSYLALVDSDLLDRERELVEAQQAVNEAREERGRAASKLRSLKSEFDREFSKEEAAQ